MTRLIIPAKYARKTVDILDARSIRAVASDHHQDRLADDLYIIP